ncbi:MAG: hypothetical protein HYU69_16450 [Bacteroidetes bacterium]|nr:hypothetical protein [Bacteroidota bacterium]
MADEPYFLEIEENHLSIGEAKRLVTETLLNNGIKSPKGGWERASFLFGPPDKQETVTFQKLFSIARKHGVVAYIQGNIDRTDDIFGGTFGISSPTMAFGTISSSYAGFSRILKPPMTDQPVEYEISEDIMFYREEICLFSNEYDFTFCTRYYRAYLTSCIALVDAFINRHILLYKFRGQNSQEFEELQRTSRLEDRLELFLKVSTGKDLTAINGGAEWIHFKNLRRLRNEMTHINSPSLGYSITEFAEHLNYAKKGVGGLLRLIRQLQGKQSLGFIEKVRTAPIIYFNEITHKADGKHIIKRRK